MSKCRYNVLGLSVSQEEIKHPVHLRLPMLLAYETLLTLCPISTSP